MRLAAFTLSESEASTLRGPGRATTVRTGAGLLLFRSDHEGLEPGMESCGPAAVGESRGEVSRRDFLRYGVGDRPSAQTVADFDSRLAVIPGHDDQQAVVDLRLPDPRPV